MPRSRRPTQSDIARAAGVSPAVVSLVINNRTDGKIRISADTQARVREAIRTLGYVPNMAARQLAGGRNNLLGVFTYEPVFPLTENSFYYPFLVGIEEQAEALGYDLLLFTRAAGADGRRQVYRDGVNALLKADAAILLGTNEDRAELARLHREDFPFVFVGRREIDGEPLAYVGADYATAAATIVARLVALGHREFAYIAGPVGNESAMDRAEGIRSGLRDAGLPDPGERHLMIPPSAIDADLVARLLREGVTAFIGASISLANTIAEAAASLGKTAPRDYSLAALGNDNENVGEDGSVTSLHIPRREMGAGAVQLLVKMLLQPAEVTTRQIMLPCAVVDGASAGPPPTADA